MSQHTRQYRRPGRRAIGALLAALAIVAGCQDASSTEPPTGATSPTLAVATPAVSPSIAATQAPTSPPTPPPGTTTGSWSAAGSPGDRAIENAVALGDGRVLVLGTGTASNDAVTPTADLWDPRTGTWRPTAPLNKVRSSAAAVTLVDGRALVAGGVNESSRSFSSAYVYDPSTEGWTKTGLMDTARTAPSAAVLGDGRVLVAGGYFAVEPDYGLAPGSATLAAFHPDVSPPFMGNALATAELFDPTTGTWSRTGSMRYARFDAPAVTLADGRVLIVGSGSESTGVVVDGGAQVSAEIYDPATGTFALAGKLPEIDTAALEAQGAPRSNPMPDEPADTDSMGRLVALDDGGAVLVGWSGSWKHVGEIGRSFRFDVAGSAWREIGQTYVFIGEPTRRALHTPGVPSLAGTAAARVPGGKVLVAGGTGANLYPTTGYNEAYTTDAASLYDPVTDTWSSLPPMPEPRGGAAVVSLADGSVMLIGRMSDVHLDVPNEDGENDVYSQLSSAVRFIPSP